MKSSPEFAKTLHRIHSHPCCSRLKFPDFVAKVKLHRQTDRQTDTHTMSLSVRLILTQVWLIDLACSLCLRVFGIGVSTPQQIPTAAGWH